MAAGTRTSINPEELVRGDLIDVQWVDINEDPVGDPVDAAVLPRLSVGYFWGLAESHGVKCLVTTTTMDKDGSEQSGYCIYPLSVVLRIRSIRKKRRRKKKDERTEH